jgi:4-hydroxy-tetrahydrodipicolinate reductase
VRTNLRAIITAIHKFMSDETLQVAVLGAGRMGQQVVRVLEDEDDCRLAGIWSRNAATDLAELLAAADVAIDFTLPEATAQIANVAVEQGTHLVCGVTGLDSGAEDAIDVASRHIAVLYDRNMSRGIALMARLLPQAARALGADFSVEIRETHHVHKKDAPSGTAIVLREALGDDSIDIESRREGEVLGDHLVRFSSDWESIEIAHSVSDRRVFAEGAVAAARWLKSRPPGRYRMADIWSEG